VSGAGGAGADGNSERPSISADGGSVAFESEANNLSALDDNSVRNIFLRELVDRPEAPGPGPGTPTPNPDRTPPGLGGSRAKSPQKLGKPIKVTVLSDEDAAVTVTATAKPQGKADKAKASKTKTVKFKAATAQVRAGTPVTLTLKLTKAAAARLKAAAKAKAKIGITATDSAGNRADEPLTVRLR
jgi:plastocyanin